MGTYDNALFEELDIEALDAEYFDEEDLPTHFESDDYDYWSENGPSIWDDPNFKDDWEEFYVDEEESEGEDEPTS